MCQGVLGPVAAGCDEPVHGQAADRFMSSFLSTNEQRGWTELYDARPVQVPDMCVSLHTDCS